MLIEATVDVITEGECSILPTADWLAQLVEHRTAAREVEGSDLDRINTQGL